MSAGNETPMCRLCFSTQNHQMNIFDNLESNVNIAKIIDEHIGEVSVSDALPNFVCVECWTTTENFHTFHRNVKSAQSDYLKQLVKCELANDFDDADIYRDRSDIKPSLNFVEVGQSNINDCFDESNEATLKKIKCDELQQSITGTEKIINHVLLLKPPDIDEADDSNPLNDFDERLEEDNSDTGSEEPIDTLNEANSKGTKNFDCSCDICQVDLKTLKRAIAHYKKEHDMADGYIKCCGLKLKRQQLVDDHIQWHLNPNIFKCKHCDKIMKTKMSLATHLTSHKYLRACTCDLCGKIFSQKDKLKRHMLFTHINSFECKICTKRCSTKEKLQAHEKLDHRPAGNAAEIRKKLDSLIDKRTRAVSTSDAEEVMAKYFDMTCEVCGDVLKSLQQAQFHYMHEHQMPNGYIRCCGIKFEKPKKVNDHVAWHLNPEIFKCNICGSMKKTVASLRVHLKGHATGKGPREHFCVECKKSYFRKHHLVRHMKDVHGTTFSSNKTVENVLDLENTTNVAKYFDMTCDVCGIILDSLQHAKMHYLDAHGNFDGYIKCCDLKFKELKEVNEHLEFHINPDIFKCNICGKNCGKKEILQSHLYRHRVLETKMHECDVCHKACRSKQELNMHRKTHAKREARFSNANLSKMYEPRRHNKTDPSKTEICEFCAKSFSTRSSVLAHVRKMHSENATPRERFQCEVCDASLSNRATLKDHMLRHSSEPQKCLQCDKIAPNQSALICHIRSVHTERIHKCHLCEKSFKAAGALKDHVATHTGEKLYKCLYCPESFIWRPNCYSHQKKAHPREWSDDQLKKTKAKSL